jgi:predicted esterase
MIVRTIPAEVHGRYLVEAPRCAAPTPLLVGFHGYAEAADTELDRLRAMAPEGNWLIVSVQAMHPFYRRHSQDVVANWMTRQDRELAIADNIAYVNGVIDAVAREWPLTPALIFSGFSQGVAMAFRAAVSSPRAVTGAIVSGGDVPPEIAQAALSRVPRVLIARGRSDAWYTSEKFNADTARLTGAGAAVVPLEFDGGHEWAPPLVDAATAFLETLR